METNKLLIGDTEWNSTATAQNTYCSKFSTDDGSTTFRLPKFAPFVEIGTIETANTYHASGIPNITGYIGCPAEYRTPTGAFYTTGNGVTQGHEWSVQSAGIDASRCSTVYKNDCTTVQPESIIWLACIQAK